MSHKGAVSKHFLEERKSLWQAQSWKLDKEEMVGFQGFLNWQLLIPALTFAAVSGLQGFQWGYVFSPCFVHRLFLYPASVYSSASESSFSKGKQQMMFSSQIYKDAFLIPNCAKQPLDIDSELRDLSFIHCYCRSEFMLCIATMIVIPSTYTRGETESPKTEHKPMGSTQAQHQLSVAEAGCPCLV